MKNVGIIAVTAFAIVSGPLFVDPSAEAATVRRHLRCAVVIPGFSIGTPFGTASAYPLQITNQWAITIPPNTTYTIRWGRKFFSFKRPQALAQGQSFAVNAPGATSECGASVPG